MHLLIHEEKGVLTVTNESTGGAECLQRNDDARVKRTGGGYAD
jgi:hypothetical protein